MSERLLSQVYITCSKSSVVTTVYNALFTAAPTAKLAKLPAARPATRQNEASVAATSLSSALIRGLRSGDDDTTIQSDPRYLAYKLTRVFIILDKKRRRDIPVGHGEQKDDQKVQNVRIDEWSVTNLSRGNVASKEDGNEQGTSEREEEDTSRGSKVECRV